MRSLTWRHEHVCLRRVAVGDVGVGDRPAQRPGRRRQASDRRNTKRRSKSSVCATPPPPPMLARKHSEGEGRRHAARRDLAAVWVSQRQARARTGAWHEPALSPPRSPAARLADAEWEKRRCRPTCDRAAFDLAVTEAFAGVHPLMGETRALVIVQGGRIVFERYGDGYTRDTRLISWSMAKSITQALVGAAVLQERVAIDAPMGNPHWRAGDRARVDHVARMAANGRWPGLRDRRDRASSPTMSRTCCYGRGRRDTARLAAQPAADPRSRHALELQFRRHDPASPTR